MHACSPREVPVYQIAILPPEIDDLISIIVMGAWGYLMFLILRA